MVLGARHLTFLLIIVHEIDLDDTSDYAHSFDSGSTNEQSLGFYRPDLLRLGLGFTKHSTLSLARSGEMEIVCTFLELTNTFRFPLFDVSGLSQSVHRPQGRGVICFLKTTTIDQDLST